MRKAFQIHDDYVAVEPDPDHFDHCGCCDVTYGSSLCQSLACTGTERIDKRDVYWVYRQCADERDLEAEDELKDRLERERIDREDARADPLND